MLVRIDVFIELLINFLNNFWTPIMNLIIHKVHFFVEFLALILLLWKNSDPLIESIYLRSKSVSRSVWIDIVLSVFLLVVVFILSIFHLQFMKFLSPCLMIFSQIFNFAFVIRDLHKKMWISLLSCKELLNNFVNISETSCSSNVLEGILNLVMIVHLILHLSS